MNFNKFSLREWEITCTTLSLSLSLSRVVLLICEKFPFSSTFSVFKENPPFDHPPISFSIRSGNPWKKLQSVYRGIFATCASSSSLSLSLSLSLRVAVENFPCFLRAMRGPQPAIFPAATLINCQRRRVICHLFSFEPEPRHTQVNGNQGVPVISRVYPFKQPRCSLREVRYTKSFVQFPEEETKKKPRGK